MRFYLGRLCWRRRRRHRWCSERRWGTSGRQGGSSSLVPAGAPGPRRPAESPFALPAGAPAASAGQRIKPMTLKQEKRSFPKNKRMCEYKKTPTKNNGKFVKKKGGGGVKGSNLWPLHSNDHIRKWSSSSLKRSTHSFWGFPTPPQRLLFLLPSHKVCSSKRQRDGFFSSSKNLILICPKRFVFCFFFAAKIILPDWDHCCTNLQPQGAWLSISRVFFFSMITCGVQVL